MPYEARDPQSQGSPGRCPLGDPSTDVMRHPGSHGAPRGQVLTPHRRAERQAVPGLRPQNRTGRAPYTMLQAARTYYLLLESELGLGYKIPLLCRN